jgi:miniconductance mechanosensitive channel
MDFSSKGSDMNLDQIQSWILVNPFLSLVGVIILSVDGFFVARFLVGQGLNFLSKRTETEVDDIIVKHLHPYRIAWLVPLGLLYFFAYLLPDYQNILQNVALFFVLWVVVITINALLSALNEIYESRPGFSGVSIQGYLDILKISIFIVGLILSISLVTGDSPLVLLTGLGAMTAVLMLVFRDTILSIVASIQISSHDLIKEGDWIEVPSYGADGDVLNMDLHTIKIQNWDKTITVIPTYKIVDVAYKNWRGMQESGGRRIKRSILIDMNSIVFCDQDAISEFRKIDLIQDYLTERLRVIDQFRTDNAELIDSPLDGPQITNVEIYRSYIEAYLKNRDDIHQKGLTFLIRALAPARDGLPIEVYAFSKTTDWVKYEGIQGEIFDHLLAAAPVFGLQVFQEPTGLDFASFASRK